MKLSEWLVFGVPSFLVFWAIGAACLGAAAVLTASQHWVPGLLLVGAAAVLLWIAKQAYLGGRKPA